MFYCSILLAAHVLTGSCVAAGPASCLENSTDDCLEEAEKDSFSTLQVKGASAVSSMSFEASSREESSSADLASMRNSGSRRRSSSSAEEPNPPSWPKSVKVFSPEDEGVGETVQKLSDKLLDLRTGHFSKRRLAFLFKPGKYSCDIEVGYYVQVLGLGKQSSDVVFNGKKGVYAPAMDPTSQGSLDTFWRSAENFRNEASDGMTWAVSQAAPLRRIHVTKDLRLHSCDLGKCQASGGFMANLIVDGKVDFGPQQQWFSRNVDFNGGTTSQTWTWNFVHLGCNNAPESTFPDGDQQPITRVTHTPVRAEKPFITISGKSGKYYLRIPKVRTKSNGADLIANEKTVETVSFSKVYVATADHPELIQAKLDEGKHVVLTPGIYKLEKTLRITHPGQTLLGLGLATLMSPRDGRPCVKVEAKVPGVRIAGILLGASVPEPDTDMSKSSLLLWGSIGDPGDASDPGFLFDIFARVGGDYSRAQVDTVMKIYSGHVIGDHIWLWRADHAKLKKGEKGGWNYNFQSSYHLVQKTEAKANHGLKVYGDDVYMYGLQVEHFHKDQTVWFGNRGRTYFYQCELPYDVDQKMFGDQGWAGYHVNWNVWDHRAYGVGIYTFFRDSKVEVPTAIKIPERCGDAGPGTACYGAIQWARHEGIPQHPEWYNNELHPWSSDQDIQKVLARNPQNECLPPCVDGKWNKGDTVIIMNAFTKYLTGYGGVKSIIGFTDQNGKPTQTFGKPSTKDDTVTKRMPFGLASNQAQRDAAIATLYD
eukprot:TRINITY_DN23194_c0_g1_i1.p1 TRINITY_DN23194_c0_g1~~TRINITY_DN23194_c0_g1_i1.p1  ORF type:complete len:763 (-),score=139.00 TRINITY_DN23194_c0_g1_i1:22-2310(-)